METATNPFQPVDEKGIEDRNSCPILFITSMNGILCMKPAPNPLHHGNERDTKQGITA
ncbi:hypothetical protein RGU12_10915 [Fredinandcohnia sp. QZ13]|uniref:hypothetical protein n=1 Tax=Fredinandcohnia sp. QZ13 TaxID=3073144 RepID=UPI002853568B|nr:hypothetical protein [Fredinandcohnia sp. QZ13]MDR4888059.1 hypothetical protein [Fredinandcohnia sp. QZ13]